MVLEIRALGSLELHDGSHPISLGERQRALLAVLVVHARGTVSTDRLMEEAWSGRPPRSAQAALQVHVSRLRQLLARGGGEPGPQILTRRPGYQLEVPPACLDVDVFEELVAQGRAELVGGRAAEASSTLRRALARWRGAPLGDLGSEPFALGWSSRLEQLRRTATGDLFDAELARGHHLDIVGELEALALEEPLDERVCAQLMIALHRSGRGADALRAYQALRRALAAELGIEPGADLRRLEDAIVCSDLDAPVGPRAAVVVPPTPAPMPPGDAHEAARPSSAPISAGSGSTGGSVPSGDPFVGRGAELAALEAARSRAGAGLGGVVIVTGEPGAGKTRLVEELAASARAEGTRVLWGRSHEGGASTPFWPWIQVLRSYLRVAGAPEVAEVLAPHRDELATVLPELGGTPPAREGDADAARLRLFDRLATVLAAASARRPVVIVLDDVHTADRGSLRLLEHLADGLADVAALVVCVARDEGVDARSGWPSTLGSLARRAAVRLRLGGLEEEDVGRWIELVTGAAMAGAPAAAIAAEVRRRTGGNPFFVREVVQLVADSGSADGGGGPSGWSGRIPPGVRDVVRRRVASLSEDARRVLEAAAVVGSVVDLPLLQRVRRATPDAAVEELLTCGLLREDDLQRGELRFAHDLVREAVYADLPLPRRARLHLDVGEALAEQADAGTAPVGEVARHLVLGAPAGADAVRAADYDVLAAEAATRALGYEDAVSHYERALTSLGARDPARRCRFLLDLGDARWRAGAAEAARTTFLDAADLARTLGDARLLGRAVLGYGGGLVREWHTSRGDANERLIVLLEEALERLGGADEDEELRVRLLGRLAEELYYEPSAVRREQLSAEAVRRAERLEDPRVVASALCSRCLVVWDPDHLAERLDLCARIVELGRRLHDPELWMFGQHHLILAALEVGDRDRATRALAAYERRAALLRQPLFSWRAKVLGALDALLVGRFADAEQLAGEALAVGERARDPDALNVYATQIGMVRMEQDRLDEVRPLLAAFTEEMPETPWWDAALAFVDVSCGRCDDARRRFDRLAADGFRQLPRDFVWTTGIALLALVCAALDDRPRAAALHDLLEPYATTTAIAGGRAAWGSVAMYLGVLATTMGDDGRAEAWFVQALANDERMDAVPWATHTRAHHAAMLLARGEEDDRERAGRLLDDARRTASSLGMARLLRSIAEVTPGGQLGGTASSR